jgi:DnaJ domain
MKMDYYKILELSPDATQAQIKQQYRLLLHAWHPDKFPNQDQKLRAQERTKALNEAYSILGDPKERVRYDTNRSSERAESSEQPGNSHAHRSEAEGRRASKVDRRQHTEERAKRERGREAEAEASWRRKVAQEGVDDFRKPVERKASFLKNLFNKARCAVGAHKGQWIYSKPDECTQVRQCELCQELSARTAHDWAEWRFQSDDDCDCARTCTRCGEIDYDTQHNWAHWEYLGATDCTQVQICLRCQAKSEHTRVAHDWSEWSYSEFDHQRSRVCRRCRQRSSEVLPPSNREILSEPSMAGASRPFNGIWLAGDGLPIQFQQAEAQISFRGVNAFGVVVVDGHGTIQGNQAHLKFQYFDGFTYDMGQTIMQISPDGRRMDGIVHFSVSGIRRPMGLVKQIGY